MTISIFDPLLEKRKCVQKAISFICGKVYFFQLTDFWLSKGQICLIWNILVQSFEILARLRQTLTAFLLNRAITRHASGSRTSELPCPSYMQNFIKIGVAVWEKNVTKILTLCNFSKDLLNKKYCLLIKFELGSR